MRPFTHTYKPKKTEDIIGHEKAIVAIKKFILNYKKEKKKILIITGPVGCGKTSIVSALAADVAYELLEVNTSDARNEEGITNLVGTASKQKSLFFQGKIILLDDIDGLSGTNDRGGISALLKIAQESTYPLICTAADITDQKFSSLRSKAVVVTLESPSTQAITDLLKKICEQEQILFEEDALRSLARRCGGDIRGAINDIQTLAKIKIMRKDIDALSEREREEEMQQALFKIFKQKDPHIANSAFAYVQEDPDTLFLWIDENLPGEYEQKEDRARAYDYVSKADIFKRRIQRQQHWRFLSYITDFLTTGICVAKTAKNPKMIEYKRSGRILYMWIMNQKNAKRKSIAEKIAGKMHVSKKRAIKEVVPYMQIMAKNETWLQGFAEEYDLDDDELIWLKQKK